MDGQQFHQIPVARKVPQQQQQQQQQHMQAMMQQQQAQPPPTQHGLSLSSVSDALGFETFEGQISSAGLIDQSMRVADSFFGSQPRGALMQEVFTQGVVSVSQVELLRSRLRGLCRDSVVFADLEEVYRAPPVNIGASAAAPPAVQWRLRRSCYDTSAVPVIRYLGGIEQGDKVLRRSYLEASVKGPLSQFLRNLGFKKEFEFIAEGDMFVRGRAKCLIYSVFEAHSSGNSDSKPLKGRNVAPSSQVVEVSAVGSQADEMLQREVLELTEVVAPLVSYSRLDYARILAMRP